MTPEEFREAAHTAVDWVADYLATVEQYPVLSQVTPGEIRARLPEAPPIKGEPFEDILRDLNEIVMPGITHWQSPNFYSFFPANASGPAIIGDLVSAGLGVQGMLWATSPAATELETHVLDWLVDLLALPTSFKSSGRGGGVIQDTASSASLVALVAARESATGFVTNEDGVQGRMTAYASTEAHSSVEKAVGIAGMGRNNLRHVATDEALTMSAEALDRAITEDREAGRVPCFVAATVGTTSSTAFDSVRAVGEVCERHGVWLHVDAALAGSAAVCPEFRWMHDGLEYASSYCFNPHKWLLTNFDCDCFFVADRETLLRSLTIVPEYLRNAASDSGDVIDYRDWQVPLGRRFRALKLWFVLRSYGVEGLQAHIRKGVGLAQEFTRWVEADDRFELAAPTTLNLVCFRHVGDDAFNVSLLNAINASGRAYLNQTKINDRVALRMAIGGTYTERHHVEETWDLIRERVAAIAQGKGEG